MTSILKLPDVTDPQYYIDGGPIEHLAHTKEHLLDFYLSWIGGKLESARLESRMIPLSSMDILFWEKSIGGFKRDLQTMFTVDWAYLHGYPESPWSEVFENGDNRGYNWWQITKMTPSFKLGTYGLWCIETNPIFLDEQKTLRSDDYSNFDVVFAKTDEIAILTMELARFK